MKYIIEFFDDKHNFFNKGSIICIFIFITLCLIDCISTMEIISRGGLELNPHMVPYVRIPLLFFMIKLIAINLIICGIKLCYDIIQDKFYTKYNSLCIYFAFAIPTGLTLCIVINNLFVLYGSIIPIYPMIESKM